MIYILSSTTKKHHKNIFQATPFKFKENSRTFQGLSQKFKYFFKTVRTLGHLNYYTFLLFSFHVPLAHAQVHFLDASFSQSALSLLIVWWQ